MDGVGGGRVCFLLFLLFSQGFSVLCKIEKEKVKFIIKKKEKPLLLFINSYVRVFLWFYLFCLFVYINGIR
jgi:hypothetical protein